MTGPRGTRLALTYEDYALLPQDGRRWELVEGDFVVSPVPFTTHQAVVFELSGQFREQLRNRKLARVLPSPLDVILDRTNTVQLDLVVVKLARKGIITRRGVDGVPDLVVEVVSPHNPAQDLVLKRHLYERFAVPEYWLVDPDERSVQVLSLEEESYVEAVSLRVKGVVRSPLFCSLRVSLEELFAELS
ncbi:MAG: Uma2 family endonuclease [Myxococcaceae bacterium]|nr:Uma2 family endonuclease [Myxococcaceae bacterium]